MGAVCGQNHGDGTAAGAEVDGYSVLRQECGGRSGHGLTLPPRDVDAGIHQYRLAAKLHRTNQPGQRFPGASSSEQLGQTLGVSGHELDELGRLLFGGHAAGLAQGGHHPMGIHGHRPTLSVIDLLCRK
jgi:hypothetical protein